MFSLVFMVFKVFPVSELAFHCGSIADAVANNYQHSPLSMVRSWTLSALRPEWVSPEARPPVSKPRESSSTRSVKCPAVSSALPQFGISCSIFQTRWMILTPNAGHEWIFHGTDSLIRVRQNHFSFLLGNLVVACYGYLANRLEKRPAVSYPI